MKNTWKEEEVNFLMENFDKLSRKELALHLNRGIGSIGKKIERLGLIQNKTNPWSEYEVEVLKKCYPSTKMEDFLPLLNNRTKEQVREKAQKLGIKRIKRDSDNIGTYTVNKDYFKEINSHNKAYYLGWALTDGNVTIGNGRSYQYRIRLMQEDIGILQKFLKDIESTTKIYKRDTNVEVNICSKEFVENLINQGCIPNKTYTISFPKLEKEYELDFIKGCFDGDGSYVCTEKTKKVSFVSASEDFVKVMQDKLKSYGITSYIYKTQNTYGLHISSKESIKTFVSLMLNTESDFLDRKKKKMNMLLEY